MFVLIIFVGFLLSAADSYVYHNIIVNYHAECQLSQLYEENFYFVKANTSEPIHTFILDRGVIFGYDIVTTNRTTLNMLYAVTCTKINYKSSQSPKVAFIIDAGGMNQLNVLINVYYGATAAYEITVGVGESFFLNFPFV